MIIEHIEKNLKGTHPLFASVIRILTYSLVAFGFFVFGAIFWTGIVILSIFTQASAGLMSGKAKPRPVVS